MSAALSKSAAATRKRSPPCGVTDLSSRSSSDWYERLACAFAFIFLVGRTLLDEPDPKESLWLLLNSDESEPLLDFCLFSAYVFST